MENILKGISGYDPDELAARRDLGSINFTPIKNVLARTVEIARELAPLPVELLPPAKQDEISKAGERVILKFRDIASFKIEGLSNPQAHRDDLMRAVLSECESFCNLIIPVLPYLQFHSASFQSALQGSDELLQSLKQRTDSEVRDLEERKKELDSIIQVARDTAAQTGVAQHAVIFQEIAGEHQRDSKQWLIATVALALLTILIAFGSLYLFPAASELKDAATIQRILTKIVILSVTYYATIWSAKNYRTHRHLSVLNLHRHNALQTFETFDKPAGDAQTKSAVLLEATRCIFSSANTGYLGPEEENPTSRIVEIVRSMGTGSGVK